jgi:hypothetical protein
MADAQTGAKEEAARVKPSQLWVGATDDVVLAGVAKLEAAKTTGIDNYIAVATTMLEMAGFKFWKTSKSGGRYHTLPHHVTGKNATGKYERKRKYTDNLDQLIYDYYGILSTFDEHKVDRTSASAKRQVKKVIREGEAKAKKEIEKILDQDAEKYQYKRQRTTLPKTDDNDDSDDNDDDEFADYHASWGCHNTFE